MLETQDGSRETGGSFTFAELEVIPFSKPFWNFVHHESSWATPKTWVQPMELVSICCRSWAITTSGIAVAILRFGYRSTSADVGDDTIKLDDSEIPGLAVKTLRTSVVEREI
jgi:hypothetical protein